jgi:hypothetical protein
MAVGLAVAESAPHATRLANVNATLGIDTLENEAGESVSDRHPRHHSIRRSLVAATMAVEQFAGGGIPPLRTATWTPAEPSSERGRSSQTPADVLPIISGEPDPRMDKLKQWLLNIESEIQRGNAGYTIMRDRFFEIIAELAQGLALEHEGIQDSNRVTVTASDGQILIEAVSQGTTSLLSGIGVLPPAALRYLRRSGRGSIFALRSGTHRGDRCPCIRLGNSLRCISSTSSFRSFSTSRRLAPANRGRHADRPGAPPQPQSGWPC